MDEASKVTFEHAQADGSGRADQEAGVADRRFDWPSAVAGRLAMFGATEYVEAGMLLSYGTDALFVRAAGLVDKLMKGAVPATIPVEQATTFDLVINRRTARALGLDVPSALLLQATRLID